MPSLPGSGRRLGNLRRGIAQLEVVLDQVESNRCSSQSSEILDAIPNSFACKTILFQFWSLSVCANEPIQTLSKKLTQSFENHIY